MATTTLYPYTIFRANSSMHIRVRTAQEAADAAEPGDVVVDFRADVAFPCVGFVPHSETSTMVGTPFRTFREAEMHARGKRQS